RARMLILELSPGDVSTTVLTNAQSKRDLLPGAIAGLAQHIAGNQIQLKKQVDDLRTAYRDIGHTRTPGMLARLVACGCAYIDFAQQQGVISNNAATKMKSEAKANIEAAGGKQQSYLEDADPVDIVLQAIRQAFGAGLGHVRSLNGGVPQNAS